MTQQANLLAKAEDLAAQCARAQAIVDDVSHEFRTPLAVLKEFTSLFLEGMTGDISDTQRHYLEIMGSKINDLTTMVNDLLDSRRIESGSLGVCRVPCNLIDIIRSATTAMDIQAHAHGVLFRLNYPDSLPEVYCDPANIRRVITNLLSNAMKYSLQGRIVTLSAEYQGDTEDVIVRITDQGPGIAPEQLETIFERFSQNTNGRNTSKGFGLGLNIVQNLVQMNLGTVSVESEIGRGSTFSFTVPRYTPQQLVRRFLDSRKQFVPETKHLSLVRAEIYAENDKQRRKAAEWLNHSLRPSDLLLPGTSETNFAILSSDEYPEQTATRLTELTSGSHHMLNSSEGMLAFFPLCGLRKDHDIEDVISRCFAEIGVCENLIAG